MTRKKTVKPTLKEAKKIKARLQRQYPQMFEPVVGKQEKRIIGRASPADEKALERMVGKRLKAIYRSNKK